MEESRMSEKSDLVVHRANDVGGRAPGGPLTRDEHEMTPSEKACHALLNVLDVHKLVNTEEKRRAVEDLGGQIIGSLTYYERWAVAASQVLMEKGLITSEELGRTMDDVRRRWAVEP
jgi:Nitrile hydratase beta subunit